MSDLLPWTDSKLWSELHKRHGHASQLDGKKGTPTYVSWQAMRVRCKHTHRDPDAKYTNRGISFDPAWDSFEQFLSDMGERPEGTTLDRIDNNQGYSKDNCRWASARQQARNRRNARLTFPQAVEVAVRRLRGETCKSIAADFGCSESLPREIAKGRTWPDARAAALEVIANG